MRAEGRGGEDLELLETRRGGNEIGGNIRDKFRWSIEIEAALNEAMLDVERTRHGEGISSGRKMRSLAGLIVSKPVRVAV